MTPEGSKGQSGAIVIVEWINEKLTELMKKARNWYKDSGPFSWMNWTDISHVGFQFAHIIKKLQTLIVKRNL